MRAVAHILGASLILAVIAIGTLEARPTVAMASTTIEAVDLLPEHIEVIRLWAESYPRSEVAVRCADMVSQRYQERDLRAPLPSTTLKYCEKVLDEQVYAKASAK